MTSSVSYWFTSKLVYSSFPHPHLLKFFKWKKKFLKQPYLEQEASSALQIRIGCEMIPFRTLNAHWSLSFWFSRNLWWLPTCLGTECFLTHGRMKEKLLSVLDSFHGLARPQVPHFSIANSHHTAKEQTECQSCLLKRNVSIPKASVLAFQTLRKQGRRLWHSQACLYFLWFYLKYTSPLSSFSGGLLWSFSSAFKAHFTENFL